MISSPERRSSGRSTTKARTRRRQPRRLAISRQYVLVAVGPPSILPVSVAARSFAMHAGLSFGGAVHCPATSAAHSGISSAASAVAPCATNAAHRMLSRCRRPIPTIIRIPRVKVLPQRALAHSSLGALPRKALEHSTPAIHPPGARAH